MSLPALLPKAVPNSGIFQLPASKSLANRALIISALATDEIALYNLSDAKDTATLALLLKQVADGATLDCGPAGTTFRFLTAYLCTQPGQQLLTGSARMLERPIGALVDALCSLGAEIEYTGKEGYPPLKIGEATWENNHQVSLPGNISSQYLSALMLIGPVLPKGIQIEWTGELVSRPYLEMTASLMSSFGASLQVQDSIIRIAAGGYTSGTYQVESDWSAASYAAAWAAVSAVGTEIVCAGLERDSLQGDSQLCNWIADWGVDCDFEEDGVCFRKTSAVAPEHWECDFETSPDLAQTFAVLCAVTGTTGLYSGLQTLSIKETDRIEALKAELQKVGVYLSKLPSKFSPNSTKTFYMQEGKAAWEGTVEIATYHDHRMAMAFSLLAAVGNVNIEDADVVGKSFPKFWNALHAIGVDRDPNL